jgi:hypothetical protein
MNRRHGRGARQPDRPYVQLFCGEIHFQHALPLDRSPMTRWRQRIGAAEAMRSAFATPLARIAQLQPRLRLRPEARRHANHPPRDQAARRHRAGDRPDEGGRPFGRNVLASAASDAITLVLAAPATPSASSAPG